MAEFLQYLLSGITIGFIYGSVAIGFTLIYNACHVVNFAQGEFVMLGAMLTVFVLSAGMPYPVAAFVAVAATAVVGLALYDLTIRPARGASPLTLIIVTIGASILIRGLAQVAFGTSFFTLPAVIKAESLTVAGAVFQPQGLVVIGGTLSLLLGLWLLLHKTLIGKAIIASSTDSMAAQLVGINVQLIVRLSFILSAMIGAVAGILITPITVASHDMGIMLALKGFAAAMLGGMGNPFGALLGGLIVGLSEALSAGYLSSEYKDATAFIIIILVLFVFPSGLFGESGDSRV